MNEQQQKIIRDFVIISILLNDIEEPDKVPTKEVKQIYDVLKQCVGPLESIVDKVYKNKNVSNTNFIQEIERKLIYNIKKESMRRTKLK